jgi:hypothetical protein
VTRLAVPAMAIQWRFTIRIPSWACNPFHSG